MRPTSGSVIRPRSLTSHSSVGPSLPTRSFPMPPPWEIVVRASSVTASARSATRGTGRFPDARHGAAVERTLIQEAAPSRNDARRIAAQHVHVRELNARGIVGQPLLQQLDSVAADSYKHGFAAGKRFADERQRAAE